MGQSKAADRDTAKPPTSWGFDPRARRRRSGSRRAQTTGTPPGPAASHLDPVRSDFCPFIRSGLIPNPGVRPTAT
ncbi:hypothetical protein Psuf_017350 [Phytohabitans suffuscus]|uniref:Uncharacterized protein n=1 Tax=Phytohabitans suffuscus TaxID=624315 RepID=A0A6F8YE94_9ACTN|nr:hypothetical protein Psuf_017350 [Phytohabitans suffuscus]